MDFGDALRALKDGKRVARAGWNGMWLLLITPRPDGDTQYELSPTHWSALWIGKKRLPWIGMKTADDCFVPWLASQTDMLADDYELVP